VGRVSSTAETSFCPPSFTTGTVTPARPTAYGREDAEAHRAGSSGDPGRRVEKLLRLVGPSSQLLREWPSKLCTCVIDVHVQASSALGRNGIDATPVAPNPEQGQDPPRRALLLHFAFSSAPIMQTHPSQDPPPAPCLELSPPQSPSSQTGPVSSALPSGSPLVRASSIASTQHEQEPQQIVCGLMHNIGRSRLARRARMVDELVQAVDEESFLFEASR
jgi:hypothetical protein